MKILTVIGARPQMIKAAAVSRCLRQYHQEILVHTGQHYDPNMSDIFFTELSIPQPDYNLQIGSGGHGQQTGRMLMALEELYLSQKPDLVLVYGDTNSTLAGALAASKLHIPVAHVEAGLRSFNMAMPEEQNRILTDHISNYLFIPTETARENLANEGLTAGVHNVGDVMYDGVLYYREKAGTAILQTLGITGPYLLATIHRAENTDDPQRLAAIVRALNRSGKTIVLPLHPRTRKFLAQYGIETADNIHVIEPIGYLDMLALEANASKIVTDSGGVQKEAYFLAKPCITMRDETEWVETVANGWNVIVGSDEEKIVNAIAAFAPTGQPPAVFGNGAAAQNICDILNA